MTLKLKNLEAAQQSFPTHCPALPGSASKKADYFIGPYLEVNALVAATRAVSEMAVVLAVRELMDG